MTPNAMAGALTTLSLMVPAYVQPQWLDAGDAPGCSNLYAAVLGPVQDDVLVTAAIRTALITMRQRPAPAELVTLIAATQYPVPTLPAAWAQWWGHVKAATGAERMQYNSITQAYLVIYAEQTPAWSHPLLQRLTVAVAGTWAQARNIRPHLAEWDVSHEWRKRFDAAYPATVAAWNTEAYKALTLPAAARPPEFQIATDTYLEIAS